MKDEIKDILNEITGFQVEDEMDLLENDIIDSLSFIELIEALENRYNIELQPTQIPSDTWRSIDKIVELIKSKVI